MVECQIHPGYYAKRGETCVRCNAAATREIDKEHRRKEADRKAAALRAAQAEF